MPPRPGKHKRPLDVLDQFKELIEYVDELRKCVTALEMDNARLRDVAAGFEISADAWQEKYHELLARTGETTDAPATR